jgi:Uma2 family endonuclease
MTSLVAGSDIDTLADLVERLGGVPLGRIRYRPSPGTATERDVIRMESRENRLCELVEGVLVEKPMGLRESLLAGALVHFLRQFVMPRNLGLVSGEGGMVRLFAGLVRIPDVAFISWARLPGRKVPDEPIPELAPDLAVEVLSRGNTPGEMRRKREEYFQAGVAVVWMIDPEQRSATVFTSPTEFAELCDRDRLDGGSVLPGFSLPLADLFSELDRRDHGGSTAETPGGSRP